jgi:DNA repair exonuclease SbcCD nuclease subunit
MRFSFVHTADWQIGKPFGAFPQEKAAVLREERLRAVERLAEAAKAAGASAVLVAGDVFDNETVPDALAADLLSRLKTTQAHLAFAASNHDPARARRVGCDHRGRAGQRAHPREARAVESRARRAAAGAAVRQEHEPRSTAVDGCCAVRASTVRMASRTARCGLRQRAKRTCRSIRRG